MIVLGVDPGRATGWALLDCSKSKATVIRHGVLEFDEDETPEAWAASGVAAFWLSAFDGRTIDGDVPLTLAVESPAVVRPRAASGGVTPTMASGLLFAKGVAVALASASESNRCWPCKFRHCEAAVWRKRVAGKANASDAAVKTALLRLVRVGQLASLPKTNAHVRDAIGVALWAWMESKR